jgi:6-phosphogluconolactonase (cycloisomerase 2 family)
MIVLSGFVSSALSNLLVASTTLTPVNPTIAIGATQQFILSERYLDRTTDHEPPNSTTWSSNNPPVATINKMGVATGVAAGTVSMGGSHQGNNEYATLTVTVAASVAIAAQGDPRTLRVSNLRSGQVMTFEVNGLDDSVMVWRGGENTAVETTVLPEDGPGWLSIDPSGKCLYVLNHTSQSISAFTIDWQTSSLHPVVSSQFPAGSKPTSVEVDAHGAGVSVTHFQDSEVSRFRIDTHSD